MEYEEDNFLFSDATFWDDQLTIFHESSQTFFYLCVVRHIHSCVQEDCSFCVFDIHKRRSYITHFYKSILYFMSFAEFSFCNHKLYQFLCFWNCQKCLWHSIIYTNKNMQITKITNNRGMIKVCFLWHIGRLTTKC